jgi:hypothetical protein
MEACGLPGYSNVQTRVYYVLEQAVPPHSALKLKAQAPPKYWQSRTRAQNVIKPKNYNID